MQRNRKGFTLVELLIVIALLGALAVGLIGALDPFEQLKKGTDTSTRDLVNQVQTAMIRYYSIKNHMPWCPAGGTCTDPSGTNLSTTPMDTSISNMILAGELKSNFAEINAGKLSAVLVTGSEPTTTAQATAIACYKPEAKAFQIDPNTKYDANGTENTNAVANDPATCKSKGGKMDCYWCVQ